MGGAIVFPGGKVDPLDASVPLGAMPARVDRLGAADPRPLLVAAARELLEEAAMLPANVDHDVLVGLREALKPKASFASVIRAAGISLDAAALVPFARWITPEAEPRRFDARFFVMRGPPGQRGAHDDHETTMCFWAAPGEILARFFRGDLQLAPPTTQTLELMRNTERVDDVFELALRQSLEPICPTFVASDPPVLALPGDPLHAVRERRVDGSTRFVLRDGKFLSEDAPAEPAPQ